MHALIWKLNRVRTMGAVEIAHRVRRGIQARTEQLGWGLASVPPETLRTFGQAWIEALPVRFATEKYVLAAQRTLRGDWDIFALEDAHLGFPPNWNQDPKTKTIVPPVFGKSFDYRDPQQAGDVRYLWELNRHLELTGLAQAAHLTGAPVYAAGARTLLDSWLQACAYPRGANWSSALEAAIRLTNWAFAWPLLHAGSWLEDGAVDRVLAQRWLNSIYQHAHFIAGNLSRHSSANNHLLGELAGLYIASLAWPCWPDSAHWRACAKAELEREALLQNAPDGGNREQAFYYQHEALEWMLLAALFGRANGDEFSAAFWVRMEAMLAFIASMMDAGGNVPMVGDADDAHIAGLEPDKTACPYRSLLATGAVLFQRADFKRKAGRFDDKSRWLLGDEAQAAFDALPDAELDAPPRRAFPDSGYYILGMDFETPRELRLIADAGPLGYLSISAHGHADALSFTLSLGGMPFLIDPGTYTYQGDMAWREYFRGTAAHNTVRIDGQEQSVSGGRFMWLRHGNARCLKFDSGGERDEWLGEHDGYLRLSDPVLHRRWVVLDKAKTRIEVSDTLKCRKSHHVDLCWHFAEAVEVNLVGDCIEARLANWRVRITLEHAGVPPRLFRGENAPIAGWVSHRFERKMPSPTAIWTVQANGASEFKTIFEILRDER